jgi:hypothetical protein
MFKSREKLIPQLLADSGFLQKSSHDSWQIEGCNVMDTVFGNTEQCVTITEKELPIIYIKSN